MWLFWVAAGFVAYVYAGYPLLVAAIARTRPPRTRPEIAVLPSVTMVIAAHNEAGHIEAKLENAAALDYPRDRFQVVVVEDGSDDGTAEILSRLRGSVDVVTGPERLGKSRALEAGVAAATGDVVVFSDANTDYEPGALRRLVGWFADPRVGVVAGAKRVTGGPDGLAHAEGLYWRYDGFIARQEHRLGCCTAVEGEILAVRRELFEPVPPEVNDDFWLAMRAVRRGYDVAYEPSARSWETTAATAAAERRRRARIVARRFATMARSREILPTDRPLVVWQVASHKFARPLVPWAAAVAALASLRALTGRGSRHRKQAALAVAAQALFYGAAAAGWRNEGRGGWKRALYLPAFVVRSNAAAIEGLVMFVRGLDPTWERVPRAPGASGSRHDLPPAPERR